MLMLSVYHLCFGWYCIRKIAILIANLSSATRRPENINKSHNRWHVWVALYIIEYTWIWATVMHGEWFIRPKYWFMMIMRYIISFSDWHCLVLLVIPFGTSTCTSTMQCTRDTEDANQERITSSWVQSMSCRYLPSQINKPLFYLAHIKGCGSCSMIACMC